MFYGGTALARTWLPEGRLSEDVDLIAIGPRSVVAEDLVRIVTRQLAREFGRPTFRPALVETRLAEAVTVSFPSGVQLQLQLLPMAHYPPWPFERHRLVHRYADADPAHLLVPSRDAFTAWKTSSFIDRRAPRDLWDLAALAMLGPFTTTAAELFVRFGPFHSLPTRATLPAAPTEAHWQRDLALQTRLTISAEEAREIVVEAWSNGRPSGESAR